MAKYVLLAFDSDEDADAYVDFVRCAGAVQKSWAAGTARVDVRGVYKKPTKFCSCHGVKKRGFFRGRKYGWWACSQCSKPTVGWGRGDHWFLALGRNLLPVGGIATEYRGDGVFARSFKPCSVCGNTLMTEVGHATTHVYCPQCEAWR